jgi:REP element-mobilizing transposase RayT
LGSIIGQFKSVAAKRINKTQGTSGVSMWQRDYYEHVIRNETDLHRIRTYITNNPLQLAIDEENPDNFQPTARR